MLAKPINSIIKNHFQSLFNNAIQDAENDFSENISSKFKDLDHFDQVKLVLNELESLNGIILNSEHPYYINNHSSEEWLLNQFASRTFLLNVDESDKLIESIRIGKYNSLIHEIKSKLLATIPAYSYADFLDGKSDLYFSIFKGFFNITDEDYYKICDWQSENLIKVVSYLSLLIIKQIQAHCKTITDPDAFIKSEYAKIDKLENAPADAAIIKSLLSELFILRDTKVENFDDSLLLANFASYSSVQMDWQFITLANIAPLLTKVDQNIKTIFCNEATIFLTINRVAQWFDDVIAGQSLQQPISEANWDLIIQNIKKDATAQSKAIIKNIDSELKNLTKSDAETNHYLISQLESYRHQFNAFERKYFFALINEDQQKDLRTLFITNSFFGNDLKEQSKSLTEALIIQSVSWNIVDTFEAIFDSRAIRFANQDASYDDIIFLMHQMVLDKELLNEINKCLDDFMTHSHFFSLPVEIYLQNLREFLAAVFQKSLHRLQTIFEDADPTNKILFLQSRLKQLKLRELDHKQNELYGLSEKNHLYYSNLFKEFLEIEADFIHETKEIQLFPNTLPNHLSLSAASTIPAMSLPKEPLAPAIKPSIHSFSYTKYSSHMSLLTDMLISLKKNNFVAPDTDLTEFRKIFNNTTPLHPIQWIGNISELAHFVRLLHNDFQHIKAIKKDIWKVTAQLFVDANNKPFEWKKFRPQKPPAKAQLLENAVKNLK